jgi:predicted MFS family arabinose efflux permease
LSALAYQEHGGKSWIAGILLASIGAGALIGVGAVMKLLPRVRPLKLASVAFLGGATALWVLALDVPVAVLVLALGCFGAATMLVNAPVIGVLTMRTPEALRAKVMAAVITVATLAAPLGAVIAGQLIESLGVRGLLALVAGAMTLSALAFTAVVVIRDEGSPETVAVDGST